MSEFTIVTTKKKKLIENLVMEMLMIVFSFCSIWISRTWKRKKLNRTIDLNILDLYRNKNHFVFSWDLISICEVFFFFISFGNGKIKIDFYLINTNLPLLNRLWQCRFDPLSSSHFHWYEPNQNVYTKKTDDRVKNQFSWFLLIHRR